MANQVVRMVNHILLTACALSLIAGGTLAQGPVGEWDTKMDFGGREITAKLIITEGDDGALMAKWVGQQGESDLSNVKFEDGKLTFGRSVSFGAQGFEMTFEGNSKSCPESTASVARLSRHRRRRVRRLPPKNCRLQ